jgi:hypothetical protein
MTLDYTVRGQAKITVFDYVDEILTAFDKAEPKEVGMNTSTAPDSIFMVDDSCAELAQNKAVEFHNLVAKTLYATKRAMLDICTAIACLTTRVRELDKDDWTELVHLMRYIRGTRTMPLFAYQKMKTRSPNFIKFWLLTEFADNKWVCYVRCYIANIY